MISNKIKILYIFLVVSLLFSCSESQDQSETINIEELIPQSERDYEYVEEEDTVKLLKSIHPSVKKLANSLNFQWVEKENGSHFPNRFSFQSHDDYILVKEEDTIHYSHWYYEDSLRTTSALFNWMDCFGDKCQSLRFNEDLTLKSPKYFGLWATDTALIFIYSDQKFNVNNWNKALEDIYFPSDNPNYHFYQLHRKIIWWQEEEANSND